MEQVENVGAIPVVRISIPISIPIRISIRTSDIIWQDQGLK